MAKTSKQPWTLERTFPWILTIGGVIGFFASFILTLDKMELLKDPNFVPNCNLSPLVSCSSVIKSQQSALFSFPNSLIGIAGFSVLITLGVLLLSGMKAKLIKRWVWLGLQLGTVLGIIFVHWLFYQSVFVIRNLCPYCMVVWVVTITLFWYTTLYNLRTGVIKTPNSLKRPAAFLEKHHGDIIFLWFLLIIGIILNHFWYYWKTLL